MDFLYISITLFLVLFFSQLFSRIFTGIAGTIYTIYELSSGDEHQNTTFYGTELSSLKTALEILQGNSIGNIRYIFSTIVIFLSSEEQGKCALLDANTVQEIGVKFL